MLPDSALRRHDLVVFGATGFVGRLVADHLVRHAPEGIRIALAGRSRDRLVAVRGELPPAAAGWELLQADAGSTTDVDALAASARTVVSTVGPYAQFGKPLVAACAAAGTHYADLTGEVLFVREVVERHHETAQRTGARLVTSCGFDSVPSDLGVLLTAREAAADEEGQLTEVVMRVRSARGGFSGGTIASMRGQFEQMEADPHSRYVVRDPYALSPHRTAEPDREQPWGIGEETGSQVVSVLRKLGPRLQVERDPMTGRWAGPFLMAPFNTRVVRRSNALTGWSYGRTLRYREVHDTGTGAVGAARALALTTGLGALAVGMAWGPTRRALELLLPAAGEGPSAEAMARGHFRIDVEAITTTDARYRTTVATDRDPGYTGTAVMLGESALALTLDAAELPAGGGALTPATALGELLVRRLRARGFTLQVQRVA